MKRRKYLGAAIVAVFICVSLLASFILSERAIPKACAAHEKAVRAEVSKRVYESVRSVCAGIDGEFTTRIIYDENSNVSRVDLDLTAVNEICDSVVSSLLIGFEKDPTVDISVPIGSVIGIKAFSGRGRAVNVSAYVYPSFSAKIESSFSDAGINQTLHKVTLTVYCDTVSVCADETVEFSESYDFNIFQSIIVGSVPFS